MPSTIPAAPSNDVKKEPVVGVFWDYESCPPPPDYPGSAVVERIQSVTLASGSIRAFNVYVDLEKYRTRPKMAAGLGRGLREEFHSLGVSVLDCPSIRPTKTVADKMIIVDLFTFASANRSELVTLVVISGDPDLAYALSLLRQRHCKITLISPSPDSKGTGIAPGFQTDDLLTWEVILKAQKPPILGQTKNMPPSGSATISSVPAMHRQSTSEPAPKPVMSLVQANARVDRPMITLGGNAGTAAAVGASTTPLDRPPTAPNQQPPATKPAVLALTVPFTSSSGNIPRTPVTSSSSIPAVNHRTTNPTATGTSNAGGSQNFTRASVPEHLHALITVLLRVKKPRGWPEEEIYGQLRLQNKTKWNDPAVVATYVAEAVQLGIFVQSVGLSNKNRQEKTYYAIAETLKNNWR